MKKKLSILLACLMLASSATAFAAPSDINGHWCGEIIEKWVGAEKISGYPDGTFKPDNFITRAEFAKILASIVPPMPYLDEIDFKDVKEGDWYYESVAALVTLGAVSKAEYFNPSKQITRQEAMTMAGRAFYYSSPESDILNFADNDQIADYAKEYIAALCEAGLVSGYEDNTIRPLNNITRAESIKILDGFGVVYDAASLEGIMEKIYAGAYDEKPPVMYTRIDSENVKYFLGLSSLDGIEEALGSEPMMSAQAHSVCLVRAAEGTDIEKLKSDIKENVDPRKWICVGVEREDIIVTNVENLILLVIDGQNPKAIEESFLKMADSLLPKISADDKGIILYNGYYMDSMKDLNSASVEKVSKNLNSFAETNLAQSGKVYFASVPGKSYFINGRLEKPFDYLAMNNIVKQNLTKAEIIDLTSSLTLEDYLKSDLHWRQEALQNVLNTLGAKMGFSIDLSTFVKNTVPSFKGYYAQKTEGVLPEEMCYLTNSVTDTATVEHFTEKDFSGIYNTSKLESKDPYTLFLSGAAPVIKLINNEMAEGKELVIMGDSYSLSLAPLLLSEYKTVTIVDLRLIAGKIVNEYVDLSGKDVLMLYSDAVLNNSNMLKF